LKTVFSGIQRVRENEGQVWVAAENVVLSLVEVRLALLQQGAGRSLASKTD
jgi:hypothetical protein